jgi:hypothetical protein
MTRNPSKPAVAPMPPSPLAITEATEFFRLLVLSDLHIPVHPEATQKILDNSAYWDRLEHVVLLGDICSSYGAEREYREAAKFIKQLRRPYSAINGNHEFYFATPDDLSKGKGSLWEELDPEGKTKKLDRFREFYGFNSLWRAQHTPLGSFIFLGLDDVKNSKVETLTGEQWMFLFEHLGVQPEKPAYVFCHAPVMFETRLDMVYYDEERTACVEVSEADWSVFAERSAPIIWMSGHIHLRPDHYLYPAYLSAPNVWQVHCPDSWGYSRWHREQFVPQRHSELFSRHLEIERDQLTLVTHQHNTREDIARQTINW